MSDQIKFIGHIIKALYVHCKSVNRARNNLPGLKREALLFVEPLRVLSDLHEQLKFSVIFSDVPSVPSVRETFIFKDFKSVIYFGNNLIRIAAVLSSCQATLQGGVFFLVKHVFQSVDYSFTIIAQIAGKGKPDILGTWTIIMIPGLKL